MCIKGKVGMKPFLCLCLFKVLVGTCPRTLHLTQLSRILAQFKLRIPGKYTHLSRIQNLTLQKQKLRRVKLYMNLKAGGTTNRSELLRISHFRLICRAPIHRATTCPLNTRVYSAKLMSFRFAVLVVPWEANFFRLSFA